MDKYIELAKRLAALTKSDNPNESQVAINKLRIIMEKYGISETDINDEVIMTIDIPIGRKHKFNLSLISQIWYQLTGETTFKYIHLKSSRLYRVKGPAHIVMELEARYSFYNDEFFRSLDVYYNGFIKANDIYPDQALINHEYKSMSDMSAEEQAKIREARRMAEGITKKDFRKQLNHG